MPDTEEDFGNGRTAKKVAFDVWDLLSAGKETQEEIAQRLGIGVRTVSRNAAIQKLLDANPETPPSDNRERWYLEYLRARKSRSAEADASHTAEETRVQRHAEEVRTELRRRLWWPRWEDVRADLYIGPFPKLIRDRGGNSELVVLKSQQPKRASVEPLFSDIDDESLANAFGSTPLEEAKTAAGYWEELLGEYIDIARTRSFLEDNGGTDRGKARYTSQLDALDGQLSWTKKELLKMLR